MALDRSSTEALAGVAIQKLESGNPAAAYEVLEEVAGMPDAPRRIRSVFGRTLVQLGRHEYADDYLSKALVKFPDASGLFILRSKAREALGRLAEALADAEAARDLSPDQMTPHSACARIALKLDDPELALSHARPFAALFPNNPSALRYLATAALRKGDDATAQAAIESMRSIAGDDPQLRLRLMRLQLRNGRYTDACDSALSAAYLAGTDRALHATAVSAAAGVFKFIDDSERMAAVRAEATKIEDLSALSLQQLGILHRFYVQADLVKEAAMFRAAIEEKGNDFLSGSSLDEQLDQIWSSVDPEPLPASFLASTWRFADQTKWTEPEWNLEVRRGFQASKLLFNWWNFRPSQRHEMDHLIDDVDGRELVRHSEEMGTGSIVVGSHLGPALAGPRILEVIGIPTVILHGADYFVGQRDRSNFSASRAINVHDPSQNHVREVVSAIKKGNCLVSAADDPAARNMREFPFLDRTTRISTLAPRLSWRHGIATLWMETSWIDNRIRVHFTPLPLPQADEARDDFVARWTDEYLRNIEASINAGPRNLNPWSSIWR